MTVVTPGGNDGSGAFAILVQGNGSDIGWNRISGSIAVSDDFGGLDGAAVEIFYGVVCDVPATMKVGYADDGWTATDHNVFFGGQRQFTPGATDEVADPKFTSATNLVLTAASPAIGLGTTKYADIDVDGNPVGSRVDAGAYRFTP